MTLKKIILILIPTLVIVLALTQIDDDLSAESKELINRIEIDGTSDSFLYLSGIFAQEGEDPINVGRRLLAESRKLDADQSYETLGYEDLKKLPLATGDAFCRIREDGCFAYLFSSEVDAKKLLNQHQVLVSRVNKFLSFKEYKTLTKPSVFEQIPSYQYITVAERIKILSAIALYKNNKPEDAIKSLSSQFSHLRKAMELQDNLIGKMIFLMKLSEILDVTSIILAQEGSNVEPISSLSQAEKSFDLVIAREFAMGFYINKSLDRNPEFFRKNDLIPGWYIRMIFKPNMTTNVNASFFSRLENLAKLSSLDFANEMATRTHTKRSTSKFRNYAGEVLLAIASPNFDAYIARFKNLDLKITLFNQQYSSNKELKNLYYEDDFPKKVDGSICLSGPLEDKNNSRCLKVKI